MRIVVLSTDDLSKPTYGDAILTLGDVASLTWADYDVQYVCVGGQIGEYEVEARSKDAYARFRVLCTPKLRVESVLQDLSPDIIIVETRFALIHARSALRVQGVPILLRADNLRGFAWRFFLTEARDPIKCLKAIAAVPWYSYLHYITSASYAVSRTTYQAVSRIGRSLRRPVFIWWPTIFEVIGVKGKNVKYTKDLKTVRAHLKSLKDYVLSFQWRWPRS